MDDWSAMEERDGDDALQATHVNGARLDEYVLMNRNSTNYWYMQSPIIGNVAALVNSNGAIQEGYTYRGYGQATIHTGAGNDETWFTADDPTAPSSALGNPYLFTGRAYDDEFSTYYYRARSYSAANGRFLSRDPLASWESNYKHEHRAAPRDQQFGGTVDRAPLPPTVSAQSRNLTLYGYADCNPVFYVDPEGLQGTTAFDVYSYWTPGLSVHRGLIVGGANVDYGPGSWAWPLGVCPWPRNSKPPSTSFVPTTAKTIGTLKAGRSRGTRCCAATTTQVHSCIWSVCAAWNTGTFFLLGHNCLDFVSAAKAQCCLE